MSQAIKHYEHNNVAACKESLSQRSVSVCPYATYKIATF